MFPQAGAGQHRIPFPAGILDHSEIMRPHEGVVAMHQTANDPHRGVVWWILGCITMNHPVQVGDAVGIFGG